MADNPLTTDASDVPTQPQAAGRDAARTVMFADIAGTLPLYESLGDIRALSVITRALVAMEQQIYEYHGDVIKTVGQEVLCVFKDVNTATIAAIAMQQRMEHFATEAGVNLTLRVGYHCGPVILEDADVFGDAVNVAARLIELASAGQIITDAETLAGVRGALRRRARAIDRRRVRGRSAEVEVVEVGWQRRSGDPYTTEQGLVVNRPTDVIMVLHHQDRDIAVDGLRASFTIGRDEASDLPVASTKASRQHARIEWRRDKFVLFDHSTNGTYVTREGEPEVLVKHESILLYGRGVLSIGEAAHPEGCGVIRFECQ